MISYEIRISWENLKKKWYMSLASDQLRIRTWGSGLCINFCCAVSKSFPLMCSWGWEPHWKCSQPCIFACTRCFIFTEVRFWVFDKQWGPTPPQIPVVGEQGMGAKTPCPRWGNMYLSQACFCILIAGPSSKACDCSESSYDVSSGS